MIAKCCDVCGRSSNYPMGGDKKLRENFGIEVEICLDCGMWLSNYQIYERLCDNGVIDDDVYEALVKEREE